MGPTLELLFAWALVGALLVGVGRGLRRLGRVPTTGGRSLLDAGWLGLGATLVVLQVWNLVLPTTWAFALFAGAGLAGLRGSGPEALALARRLSQRRAFVLAAGLVTLVVANRALGPPGNGDSPSYHEQLIGWLAHGRLPPGLGHVDARLAFNHAWFLWPALLEALPLPQASAHLSAGPLVLALVAAGFDGVRTVLVEPARARARHLFDAVALVAAMDLALGRDLSSPTSDLPDFTIGLAVLSQVAGLVDGARGPWWPTVATAAAACAGKLSFAGTALGVGLVALVADRGLPRGTRLRRLALYGTFAAAAMGPWTVRGVVTSGCVLFPTCLVTLPVDWALSPAVVDPIRDWTLTWGRRPGAPVAGVRGHWDWVGPWLQTLALQNREVLFPVTLAFFAGAIALAGRWRRPGVGRLPAWLLLPVLVELVFWFLTVPDPRYAGGAFWGGAALATALALDAWGAFGTTSTRLALPVVLLLVGAALVEALPAFALHAAFESAPGLPLETRTLPSGLVITVPADGVCGDAPGPCSQAPPLDLRWREPGNPSAGFARGP